jgi:putative transposase
MKKSVLKYKICLNKDQREFLKSLTKKGKQSARKIKRANVLLLADEGKKDKEIQEIVKVSDTMVETTRKKFVLEGLNNAINEKSRPGKPKKINGRKEAEIITLACSKPPEGRSKWTLRLLADKVELDISHVAVHNTLKKMKLSLG